MGLCPPCACRCSREVGNNDHKVSTMTTTPSKDAHSASKGKLSLKLSLAGTVSILTGGVALRARRGRSFIPFLPFLLLAHTSTRAMTTDSSSSSRQVKAPPVHAFNSKASTIPRQPCSQQSRRQPQTSAEGSRLPCS